VRSAVKAAIVAAYALVFWVFLPAGLWMLARGLDRAFGWAAGPSWAGCLVFLGGLALVEWAFGTLWLAGRTLPVSALPPSRLVRGGPYAFVRHPVYLGFNIALFGAGLTVGSPALAWVVAPLLAPVWIAYALIEERFLVRRFGGDYRHFRRRVGMLPRPSAYPVVRVVQAVFRPLDVTVAGREHVPAQGPVILVFSHACYLDPGYVGVATRRPVRYLTTAEVYRRPLTAWFVDGFGNVAVRRYRPDPAACREMLRLLADGEAIGIAPEGERSVLGDYQGAKSDVAGIVARLGVPVVPIGVTGNYDCGPRWSGALRRRPVTVRVGPALRWDPERAPQQTIDSGLRALLDHDPQPVCFEGLPAERIARVLWRCPSCGDEAGWTAAALECSACGARHTPTSDGRFSGTDAGVTLASLGHAVRRFVDPGPLTSRVRASRERSVFGAIRALVPAGDGELVAAPDGLRFGSLAIGLRDIRSTSIERGDTLQVALRDSMWQFRFLDGSAFRVLLAVDRWRDAEARTAPRRALARSARPGRAAASIAGGAR
jgi:1-acyl-sn-glycerol-3-phosphate acyltransferase